MKKFQELKTIIANAETDAIKFYEKGNSAAGRRLRKAMQAVRIQAPIIRKEVSDLKK